MSTAPEPEAARAIQGLRQWIQHVPDSPLYRLFGEAVIADPYLLGLIMRIPNVPPMNLLLGAVKRLLTADDALAAWYPHLTPAARPADVDAAVALRRFVEANEARVMAIAMARRTQTNEVRRSAAILPWLAQEAQRLGGPVHAVDVGSAAGLNLCLDRFGYTYRTGEEVTRLGSGPPILDCENRGGFPLPEALPVFATRTGLDIAPVDVADAEEAAWLEALVWPEHEDRLRDLTAAIAVRRDTSVDLVAGDALATLRRLHERLPEGPMLLWHTVVTYQLSAEGRRALDDLVESIGRERPVGRVGMEGKVGDSWQHVRVGLRYEDAPDVAIAHPHGRWIDRPPEG